MWIPGFHPRLTQWVWCNQPQIIFGPVIGSPPRSESLQASKWEEWFWLKRVEREEVWSSSIPDLIPGSEHELALLRLDPPWRKRRGLSTSSNTPESGSWGIWRFESWFTPEHNFTVHSGNLSELYFSPCKLVVLIYALGSFIRNSVKTNKAIDRATLLAFPKTIVSDDIMIIVWDFYYKLAFK